MSKQKRIPPPKQYDRQGQYTFAYLDLLSRDGRKRSRNMRRGVADRRVKAIGEDRWLVSGGECEHVVSLQNDRLVCTDHAPAHKYTEGYICRHEAAVYRVLAWEHASRLFDKDGFRVATERAA